MVSVAVRVPVSDLVCIPVLVRVCVNTISVHGLFKRTSDQQRSRTRQAAGERGLCVQSARTDPRKNSFAIRAVETWNRLPETMKSAENGEKFRARFKRHQL
jgi:hypothetical protein